MYKSQCMIKSMMLHSFEDNACAQMAIRFFKKLKLEI